jgi:hypothetical protein
MSERREQIIHTLQQKTSTKQNVFALTEEFFEHLKTQLAAMSAEMRQVVDQFDDRINIGFKSKSKYEAQFKFGGDTLVFNMHTNVFMFDKAHHLRRMQYMKEDEMRAYCGIINVYNFLSDSFRYQRLNDAGYLIARIFINKEGHFMVEGKKRLGFLWNRIDKDELTADKLVEVVEECIQFCLDFDLYTPDFERVKLVSLNQILELSNSLKLRTDKRLGFQFSAKDKEITD